jgi:hypothetical protein
MFLGALAMAFLLIPTAQAAAANFPLTVATEGEGTGTIKCEVGGPAGPCAAEYAEGTEITFVANPGTGSEFFEWGGDCLGQADECELTIEEPTFVAAVFELEEVPLEVFAEGPGVGEIECEVEGGPVEACEAEYPFGTEIAFVAEPDSASEFVEWGGDCSGNEECELTMDEEHFVSAVFDVTHFALEIEFEGSGEGAVECEVEGGPAEECEPSYVEGTEVVLIAQAASGSEFVEWEGCDAEPSAEECEVTIDEDREVFVTFDLEPTPEFTLEVEKEGSGSGTVTSSPAGINCGSECEAEFEEGETVTLTASASLGSEFVEWEGCDAEPSATKCEVTMDEDKAVVAVFEPASGPSEFALTVSLAGTGSGTVTSSPAGINCGIDCSEAFTTGTEVTLTAAPATGSTFSGWSGACAGTGACKVTMSATRSVTATFTKESTPPPPGTAVVASTAKVKSGKALLKLTCTGEGACKGSLKLTAKIKSGGKTKNLTIGKASFNLAAGAKKTIKVKLSGPAKKAVAKKPLKAKVKGSGVRSSTVKLKK